jgi:DNA-binding transcriptional MerR regulator
MAADERTWRIGEVATATGLTVRALHHYDQIGLVVPSVRTSGGHRLYTSADLVLLYEVTAMRQLGLSLDQVGIVLAGRTDVRRVIDQQLEHVDRQIRMAQRLRKQLIAARDADNAGFGTAVRALWVDRGKQQPPGHDGADWGELVAYLDQARAARRQATGGAR